ncbi:MAG TPA: hypothetical protein VMI53_04490 [Opitutaceae bacterium]|nr:hypothetical protein [Opitutaceae bacterium]
MHTTTKAHSARLPLFATDAFGSRRSFSAFIDPEHAPSAHSLVAVTPRVRDNFALRCVFSRTASLFVPEAPHARRVR